MYVSGYTTSTSNFATTGAHQTIYGGTQDGFIAKFEDDPCFLFSFTVAKKDILCKGNKDGSIVITPKDAYYQYNYQVDAASPVTDSLVSGLDAGNHKVLIIDSKGCRDSSFVIINEPATALRVTLREPSMKVCLCADDGIGIAKGSCGNAPYSYSWNTSPVKKTDTSK